MPHFCAVFDCSNRSNREKVSFFRIPTVIRHQGIKTEELTTRRQTKWLANICRKGVTKDNCHNHRVCSVHFISGKPANLYDESNPDWAPTRNMGHEKPGQSSHPSQERHTRVQKREAAKMDTEVASTLLQLKKKPRLFEKERTDSKLESTVPEQFISMGTSTDLTAAQIDALDLECKTLREEKNNLQKYLDKLTISPETFAQNDEKVRYYTGLPYFAALMTLYNFLEHCVSSTSRSSLTKFQQFIMVLMRLRLNLSVHDLAYRFGISKTTVSRLFILWIDTMYIRLQSFVMWPEREQLRKTMPLSFRKHFKTKVAVIIDCFEIFIDRPSNLMARAQTWSSYKHHNTVKYLIGICPQGVISYISQGWGGRTSDKYVTEQSDFLTNLVPGDVVLADRGFDIRDSVGLHCAEVQIPAFTKGKKQLSALDVETTRKIANVRIHVERVIGNTRQKYTILSSRLPIDYLISKPGAKIAPIDKIVFVCCALANLSESVVPFD